MSKAIEYVQEDSVPSIVKGGEKGMVSEWEELEKLSKEELIIELVRARTCYRGLRDTIDSDNVWPWPETLRESVDEDPEEGQVVPEIWAERIVCYGALHPRDGWFYSSDLTDYGMDADQADKLCEKMYAEGILKLPEGVRFYISEGDAQ